METEEEKQARLLAEQQQQEQQLADQQQQEAIKQQAVQQEQTSVPTQTQPVQYIQQSEPIQQTGQAQTIPVNKGIQRIEGDFGGQDAYKVKGRPVNYGSETVVVNEKVLNPELSQKATAGSWMLPPSATEEQINRFYEPIAGKKPEIDQAKLDRLARMGRINEAGRSVGVLNDVLALGLGANVNKRPSDELAAKLFDENDNVYKKLDDDKNKYRDRVAKYINGRAAKPVYDTKTTTTKKNDIRETENVVLKAKPTEKSGGKDNTFNIYNNSGQVVATVEKDKAMKALSMIEEDKGISATDAGNVRLMKTKMAEGTLSDNDLFYMVQGLSLKYPSVRKFLGVNDNNAERPAGENVPFKEGLNIDGKVVNVSDVNTANTSQREAMAQKNKIQEMSGNAPVAQINLGGTTVDISKGDYEAAKIEVLRSDPTIKDEKELNNKIIQFIGDALKKGQVEQYRTANGTVKPAAKITATGKDPLDF